MKTRLEGDQDEQQDDDRCHTPRRASLLRLVDVVVAPPSIIRQKAPQERVFKSLDRRQPSDDKDKDYGAHEEQPVHLLLRGLDDFFVGEEPGYAEEEEHHQQYQQNRVWQRRKREGIENRGVSSIIGHGERSLQGERW